MQLALLTTHSFLPPQKQMQPHRKLDRRIPQGHFVHVTAFGPSVRTQNTQPHHTSDFVLWCIVIELLLLQLHDAETLRDTCFLRKAVNQ